MTEEADPLGELIASQRPRRNIDDALGGMSRAAERTRSAGDALDQLIGGAGVRQRGEAAASETDRADTRKRCQSRHTSGRRHVYRTSCPISEIGASSNQIRHSDSDLKPKFPICAQTQVFCQNLRSGRASSQIENL